MSDLADKGVAELAPALASGALSVRELVEALLARVDATEPAVRAWAHVDRAHARAEAARLDAEPIEARGAAFGLPLGVKDIVDTASLPTELGSPVGAGRRPGRDATSVARWLAADGLVRLHEYGFTVTPRGRLLLRVVAMAFDASFQRSVASARGFSRVI